MTDEAISRAIFNHWGFYPGESNENGRDVTMGEVWAYGWATDYDGDGIVVLTFATKELAVAAGYEPQRSVVITELPTPMQWVHYGVTFTDGVRGVDRARVEEKHYWCDSVEAWIGVHAPDNTPKYPDHHWVGVEAWGPHTDETRDSFEALAARVASSWRTAETHYDRWQVSTPEANRLSNVSEYNAITGEGEG